MYSTRQEEMWKPCTLSPFHFYEISSWGRIRNKKNKILSPRIRKGHGYLKINLSVQACGVRFVKLRAVHRLVALCFIPNPFQKNCINHKDNDPTNNYFENLEWVSQQENIDHCLSQKRNAFGERVSSSKLTSSQILLIRKSPYSPLLLSHRFGVSRSNISAILKRKTWKSL